MSKKAAQLYLGMLGDICYCVKSRTNEALQNISARASVQGISSELEEKCLV